MILVACYSTAAIYGVNEIPIAAVGVISSPGPGALTFVALFIVSQRPTINFTGLLLHSTQFGNLILVGITVNLTHVWFLEARNNVNCIAC